MSLKKKLNRSSVQWGLLPQLVKQDDDLQTDCETDSVFGPICSLLYNHTLEEGKMKKRKKNQTLHCHLTPLSTSTPPHPTLGSFISKSKYIHLYIYMTWGLSPLLTSVVFLEWFAYQLCSSLQQQQHFSFPKVGAFSGFIFFRESVLDITVHSSIPLK